MFSMDERIMVYAHIPYRRVPPCCQVFSVASWVIISGLWNIIPIPPESISMKAHSNIIVSFF